MEESFTSTVKTGSKADLMEGFAVYYTNYVDQGVPAKSASMAQFPFLVKYFQQRGLTEEEAKPAAAATIRTWMKQGMSTLASRKFSKTGARQRFIESAFTGNSSKIDEYMTGSFDFSIDEQFAKEKSETI